MSTAVERKLHKLITTAQFWRLIRLEEQMVVEFACSSTGGTNSIGSNEELQPYLSTAQPMPCSSHCTKEQKLLRSTSSLPTIYYYETKGKIYTIHQFWFKLNDTSKFSMLITYYNQLIAACEYTLELEVWVCGNTLNLDWNPMPTPATLHLESLEGVAQEPSPPSSTTWNHPPPPLRPQA